MTAVTGERFKLGRLVITSGALTECESYDIDYFDLVIRHATGDFGSVGRLDDAELTEEILELGALATSDGLLLNALTITKRQGVIMSVYPIPDLRESKLWIQTILAGSETYTTILLPSEY